MSLAVVMPAYCEEGNLEATVMDFLSVLEGGENQIIVVNDGSLDATGVVAEDLATRFPGRVSVVHHETNQGYGAAVRTGIHAALERTDAELIFLTDSDGQFLARQLPWFVEVAGKERADAVVGYRMRRADPLARRVCGWLWTRMGRALLRVRVRDVDCAYKLLDRRLLENVSLYGDAATISPELLAKVQARGARVVQRPVEHFPREHGHQTGLNPAVVLRSLLGLVRLWAGMFRHSPLGRAAQRLIRPHDPALAVLTVVAAVLSVVAYVWFANVPLSYPDAVSHLLISRRVLESPTPGLAQLGGVWLPLPHLLALPLIWIDAWYLSGLAGSLISMTAYVLTARYLYKTAHLLTRSRAAGLAAGAAFALCPGALYLQSTPMTELPLLACLAAAVYHLTRWSVAWEHRHLAAAGLAAMLATLTRYEAWVFVPAATVVVAAITWIRSSREGRLRRVEAHVIYFALPAFAGIAGWLAWNVVIFGDPFFFHHGEFSRASLWVSGAEVTAGSWGVSALTYVYAVLGNMGPALPILALCGLAVHLWRRRSAVPLTLLVFLPFFVFTLYGGQRPLHVEEITGDLYNVRFGLVMLLPVALLVGGLVAEIRPAVTALRLRLARVPAARVRGLGQIAAGAVIVACCVAATASGIDTRREAEAFRATEVEHAAARAAQWLKRNYTGGDVLMATFGNETMTFDSHVPLPSIVYEGSFRRWQPALRDPAANGIRWIHLRQAEGRQDQVWRALDGSAALRPYTLVYEDHYRRIYRKADT
ncbi:glycosyltransferase family 2 protein [Nonomuraea typhae]|uniref:glycosyltransferase family 2 protein n=1 Tax=Nonomuraea typhae TaxID=2603600 RepID=UPI001C6729B5|nr:glycosyltransferase family 2 protein [Nonomuraea typhae]